MKSYQLIPYKDDLALEEKMEEWEVFYNYCRPHSSHNGETLDEVLRLTGQGGRGTLARTRLFHCD